MAQDQQVLYPVLAAALSLCASFPFKLSHQQFLKQQIRMAQDQQVLYPTHAAAHS